MLDDLIINLPKDHLKHMKNFISRRLNSSKDPDRVIILVSPELKLGNLFSQNLINIMFTVSANVV